MSERVRPFSSGSEFSWWEDRNCSVCKKGYSNNDDTFKCDLDEALGIAYIGDGTISADEAKRIAREPGNRIGRCTEFEAEER